MKRLLLAGFILLILLKVLSCSKPDTGHSCRWKLCPYKGMTEYKHEHADCTNDCIKLDSLHLINPSYEYDQLDSLLTK